MRTWKQLAHIPSFVSLTLLACKCFVIEWNMVKAFQFQWKWQQCALYCEGVCFSAKYQSGYINFNTQMSSYYVLHKMYPLQLYYYYYKLLLLVWVFGWMLFKRLQTVLQCWLSGDPRENGVRPVWDLNGIFVCQNWSWWERKELSQ